MTYSVTPAQSHQDTFRKKERIFRNKSKKILFVGDSRANDMAALADLSAIGYTPDRTINFGVSGSNFGDNIWLAQNLSVPASDLSGVNNIVYICGINAMTSNTVYNATLDREALDEWVNVWKTICPSARHIVCNVFERGAAGFYSEARRASFNAAIDGPPAAPFNAIMRPAAMDPTNTMYYQPDQLHLTKAGVDTFLVQALSNQI